MRALVLIKYHVASLWNWRSVYLGRLIEPVAYFVFLVAGISGMVSSGVGSDYALYALTGIFCLLAFRMFTFTVSDVSNDRKWGVYAIFNMQGGRAWVYLVTIVVVSTVVFLVQVGVLVLSWVVTSGGVVVWSSLSGVLGAAGVGLFVVWGWVGLGAAVGALVDSYSRRDLISTLTSLPVVLSAPLFYRLDFAPGYLVGIARVNPLTYQVGWVRDAGVGSVVMSLVWVVGCFLVGSFALWKADRLSVER